MKANRAIAVAVALSTLLQACSRTVRVSPQAMEENASKPESRYRIAMKDGSEYFATRYSTTDSTLVILALQPKDERFGTAALPLAVRRADIEYMTRTGTSWKPVLVIVGVAAVIGIVVRNMINNSFDETD